MCFRWLGSDRPGSSILQLRLSPGLIYCSRLLLWLLAKIAFQSLRCLSNIVHVHFHFATVDRELWAHALTPPTPARSAGTIFNLSKPRSVHMLQRWLLSKATSAPSPALVTWQLSNQLQRLEDSAQPLWILTQSPSTLSGQLHQRFLLWKNAIMFSQENQSSHLFWLHHIDSRKSLPSSLNCSWSQQGFCAQPFAQGKTPSIQAHWIIFANVGKHSSKIPSPELVKDSF